ncbi:MAG: signal recognition particle protein [Candidatus Sericytochromatia bacterium]|nr:signal recognition particle protein [Candidatus Sericytochromatia bacterium]
MFDALSEKLQSLFRSLGRKGTLTEEHVSEALREVRRALLEADVALPVVKDLVQRVRDQVVGQEVAPGLNPSQHFIKAVHDELLRLLGGERAPLAMGGKPTVILLVGLQGSGKTTTAAKLALHLKRQGRRPLLAACDTYRPAAAKQLEVLGRQIGVPVVLDPEARDPVPIALRAREQAKAEGHDLLLVDTAGRLAIDETMMDEARAFREALKPEETLLVVDAMMGQDAVRTAEAFHAAMGLTGLVLTKLDGDTRGGAALSAKVITGCPVKFAGMGEKVDALEPFHPDRVATRILGMGDVLTLIEKVQETVTEEDARKLEQKLRKAEFDLEDFAVQLRQIRSLGSLESIFKMLPIPGLSQAMGSEGFAQGEQQLRKIEVILSSMTPSERRNPDIIQGSRKIRIARGSGTSVQEVNRLLKDFAQMRQMMKQFSGLQKRMGGKRRLPFGPPGKFPGLPGFPFPPR